MENYRQFQYNLFKSLLCLFPKTTSRKTLFPCLLWKHGQKIKKKRKVKRWEKRKKDEALFQVTLTMEGNLKGPLDESHLQPDFNCFYLPSQVALFFAFHTQFLPTVAHREGSKLLKCTFYAFVYDNNNCCSSIIFLIKAG